MSDDGESIRRRTAATDNVQPSFDENRNNETYKFTMLSYRSRRARVLENEQHDFNNYRIFIHRVFQCSNYSINSVEEIILQYYILL